MNDILINSDLQKIPLNIFFSFVRENLSTFIINAKLCIPFYSLSFDGYNWKLENYGGIYEFDAISGIIRTNSITLDEDVKIKVNELYNDEKLTVIPLYSLDEHHGWDTKLFEPINKNSITYRWQQYIKKT